MSQPQSHCQRRHARQTPEYIGRPTTTTDLLEAFVRLTACANAGWAQKEGPTREKCFTVVNAKGGSGATTVAVNLALENAFNPL